MRSEPPGAASRGEERGASATAVTEREQAEGQEEQRQRRAWVHKLDRHAATSIRGADGRGGRAGGREPCRGSLWAEDRVGCTNSLPGLEWCDFQRDRIYAPHAPFLQIDWFLRL